MKPRNIIFVVAFAALGILLGRYLAPKAWEMVRLEWLRGSSLSQIDSSNPTPSLVTPKPVRKIPAGEVSALLHVPDSLAQTKLLLTYVDSLAPADFPVAVDQVAKSTGQGRAQALSLLIGRWVEIDPKAAQAAIAHMQDIPVRNQLIREVFDAQAKQDSAGAVNAAAQLPDKSQRDEAMAGIIRRVATEDPPQALALFQSAKSEANDATHQLNDIFTRWAQKDADAATQAALGLASSPNREAATSTILDELFRIDRASAATWLDQLPKGQLQMNLRLSYVNNLAFNDPPAAARYVTSLPIQSKGNNSDLLRFVTNDWAWTDPDAAMKWVETLPLNFKKDMRIEALQSWTEIDPAAAATYAADMPLPISDKNTLFARIAMMWVQEDPPATIAWLNQLGKISDEEQSGSLLDGVVVTWANRDFDAASAYIESMPKGMNQQTAMASAAGALAQEDPAAALQWLAKFPDDNFKDLATQNVTKAWARGDPEQAQTWLAQLPPGESRDKIAVTCSKALDFTNPSQSYQFAQTIGDAAQRQQQETDALKSWIRYDPSAAQEALQASSLPENIKQQILKAKP